MANADKTKSLSAMRKMTAEIDAEVQKLEKDKVRLALLEKKIAEGDAKVKALLKNFLEKFSDGRHS